MAQYTFDQRLGTSGEARMLIRLQRLEFASWTMDALRKRKTYVLGGQASLFRAEALRAVAEQNPTRRPWDTATMVEDMQLTGDLRAMRYATPVSQERPRLRRADAHRPLAVAPAPEVGRGHGPAAHHDRG